ncbi:MAG TPA: hypothetical protein ENG92_02185 [Thiolapillus brandeum]|uniref:Uncharacterized protein n=1 Tax=Thiolapillus brandeum TaxID=1076588 RepID=A0A831NXY1_9GAMM|nr:hypothetical protein [Thiolapillus brandeum]
MEQGLLWPSPTYSCQVEVLKSAIGQKVYLVELRPDNINLGIHLSDTAFELLAVLDFPRPDPSISLAPHLVLLDDGRGINLGRIARISIDTPFNPPVEHLLYEDNFLMEKLLRRKRQLSHEFTEVRSKLLLGKLLGKVAKMERNCLKNESA